MSGTSCRQRSLKRRGGLRREVIKVTLFFATHTQTQTYIHACRSRGLSLTPLFDWLFLSSASSGASRFLPDFLRHRAPALLWHFRPRPEMRPAESDGGADHSLDRSNGPEGKRRRICRFILIFHSIQMLQWSMSFPSQALHLIGQALLEERAQLENRTVEEVSFDFSLKACSE